MSQQVSMTPKELSYWMINQIYSDRPNTKDWHINIRCIHDVEPYVDPKTGKVKRDTASFFNKNVPLLGFKNEYLRNGGLYDQLYQYNINQNKPSNNYYGVNPRNHRIGNTKKYVAGCLVFCLDLDDNKNYTKEQRLAQINFWIACGYWPSFVCDSGNGYHAYWVMQQLTDASLAEPLLQRIVAITGCKQGGSIWDVTRILRLSGFYNQKRWYAQEHPYCGIIYPEIDWIQKNPDELLRRYSLAEMEYFPCSETSDIERYMTRASKMDGDHNTNLIQLVQASMKHRKHAEIHKNAASIANADGNKVATLEMKQKEFMPTLEVLPPELSDIPFKRGKAGWMKLYCLKGIDGLTPLEEERIAKNTGETDLSASELDYRIIYALVSAKYTKDAIREFWLRPSLKLFRADKEARSPNYFDTTYDKALIAVRNAITGEVDPVEAIRKASVTNHILVHNYETFYKNADNVRHLFNGEIILKRILIDREASQEDEREYLDCEIRCQDVRQEKGFICYKMILPRKAFNSVSAFRSKCRGMMTLLTDKASDLSQFLKHIQYTYQTAPEETFHSRVIYCDGRFVFPKVTIYKDRFDTVDMASMVAEIKNKFPWADKMVADPCNKKQIKELLTESWGHILKVHCPALVCGVMGSIAATAARAIVETLNIGERIAIPTVNLRGGSTKGKSETLALFNKICGFIEPSLIGINNTSFAITRLMDVTNYMPTFIDEFKLADDTQDKVKLIRDLVRRAYTGEDMLRGHRDLSLTAFRVRCSMIISGETQLERIGNVSEFTRVFPVEVGAWRLKNSEEHFDFLADKALFHIGPYFYQYLLNEDKNILHGLLQVCQKQAKIEITPAFGEERTRVGKNLGTLMWGCKIWDRFLDYMVVDVPRFKQTFNLKEVMCHTMSGWALESGHSMKMLDKNMKTVIVARNELFDFLSALANMIQMKHRFVSDLDEKRVYWYKENKRHLYIRFKIAYPIYREYCRSQGYHPIDAPKIKSYISNAAKEGAPWLYRESTQIKIGGLTTRCLSFNRQNLKIAEVWDLHTNEADLEDPESRKPCATDQLFEKTDETGAAPGAAQGAAPVEVETQIKGAALGEVCTMQKVGFVVQPEISSDFIENDQKTQNALSALENLKKFTQDVLPEENP